MGISYYWFSLVTLKSKYCLNSSIGFYLRSLQVLFADKSEYWKLVTWVPRLLQVGTNWNLTQICSLKGDTISSEVLNTLCFPNYPDKIALPEGEPGGLET